MSMREGFRATIKDPSLNRKRNPRKESRNAEVRSADGRWRRVERLIDKDDDKYVEKVTDVDTGEIVHECCERLRDHQGHGSAKFKSND